MNKFKETKPVKDIKVIQKSKEEFLDFLEKNKKDLNTGFGAFHTNNHGNW